MPPSDENEFPSNVFADNPVEAGDDEFGRGQFATEVADLLSRVSKTGESSVVALVGSWGSGKSSLLNMVRANLAERDSPSWQVGNFTPWYFDDVSSLLEKFFVQLAALLPGQKNKDRRQRLASLFKAAAPFGELTSLAGVSAAKPLEAIANGLFRI